MYKLGLKGYENLNKLNEKYNISQFGITNMDEFDEFRVNFWIIYSAGNMISTEDAEYIFDLEKVLGYRSLNENITI